ADGAGGISLLSQAPADDAEAARLRRSREEPFQSLRMIVAWEHMVHRRRFIHRAVFDRSRRVSRAHLGSESADRNHSSGMSTFFQVLSGSNDVMPLTRAAVFSPRSFS